MGKNGWVGRVRRVVRPGRTQFSVYARHRRRPGIASLCADQTSLALFFFLRLGGQTRLSKSARIAGTQPGR
ncbi:MAG: hypothetical protein DM484_19830 [Candidatus Methylumidiphilus alinenensis]|uniref:Uncharacterized protein n=1 Tax=Candidatus Methylumidiphilus alinenensis TaxID=2202197 RepID=A0A2W4R4C1_9GAMM|nr:MAG: hypothetical protein DM484_19830 [Candidatus Methylumidiphilus alinenensis]